MTTPNPTDASLAIGVDLGGTKILAALVQGRNVVASRRRETDVSGGFDGVVDQIVAEVNALREEADGPVATVGVGVAGQVTGGTGVVIRAPNLFWEDAPLKSVLEDTLDLPVAVLNDVRAAAWGEWRHGAGRGAADVAVVFMGTGVGGGVVSGGRMLAGATNMAGELGHMTVVVGGRLCRCGNEGCLEAYVGGWAIAERAVEAVKGSPREGAGFLYRVDRADDVTAETVHEAHADGDPLATRLVTETARHLAAGMVGVVNTFNPDVLVLGGGVIEHAPFYVDRVRDHVRARALDAGVRNLHITSAELGGNAGALGAATFARAMTNSTETGPNE